MKMKIIVLGFIGLLVVGSLPQMASASIIGNVYTFRITWMDMEYSRDSGVVYSAESSGEFSITVFNATTEGGDDVYHYTYHGFTWLMTPYPILTNETVEFQENKVYFALSTTDADADNRSESVGLTIYPQAPFSHPGRNMFVNPTWTTHSSGWNEAVEDIEDNPTVSSVTDDISEGSFSLSFEVSMEGTIDVGEESQQANGTMAYTFLATYDEDGIVSSWALTSQRTLTNENSTQFMKTGSRIERIGAPSGGGALPAVFGTYFAWAGIGVVAGLAIGLGVGRKYWS